MRRLIPVLFILFNVLTFQRTLAQPLLTLDEAIRRAIAHNYDVRVADVSAQIAAANNTAGNAGLIPTLGGVGSVSGQSSNSLLRSNSGDETRRTGALTETYSLGLAGNFTVFAGGRAYLVRSQLRKLDEIGATAYKAQLQVTVSQTIQTYASVVFNQQQLVATDTAIALAFSRMELSRNKYEIGTSAKVDYLQGQVDYNAAKATRLNFEITLSTARANLNALMGEQAQLTYRVEDSLALDLGLSAADSAAIRGSNLSIASAAQTAELGRIQARTARTLRSPSVNLTLGYGYNYTTSQASQFQLNRGFGPNGGANITLPIFQAGNIERQIRVADLTAESNQLQLDRQITLISAQYQSAWEGYRAAREDYALEQTSILAARENLDIQKARFRVGLATTLEIEVAENSYVQALGRLYNAAYNVKVNETRVLELENKLVTNTAK